MQTAVSSATTCSARLLFAQPQPATMATMRCAQPASLRAAAPKVAPRVSRSALVCRADGGFIGSSTNIIMVASTTACLAAARFGLAPSVKKGTTAGNGLKLQDRNLGAVGLMSNDPAGFTVVDTLAMGAAGHAIGVGIVLGLKGIGAM